MDTPPEAFLFDLDGVLRRWSPGATAEVERRHGVPLGRIEEIAYDPDRYGPAVLGAISDDDWRASILAAMVPVCGDARAAIECVADWSEPFGRVDPEAAEVVAGIRVRGTPVALVVNATTRLELDLVALGLSEAFDTVVNSARMGVAKPDAEIYSLAAGILAVPPQRCVYVGANPAHVAGAERTGMAGHLYDGVDGLRAMLEGLPAT